MIDHEKINRDHLERCRAIHRRSAFERVLSKILYYESLERAATLTKRTRMENHEPINPPLSEDDREQLQHLRELRGTIRQEMIEAGQIDAHQPTP